MPLNAEKVLRLAAVYAGYLDRIADATLVACSETELLLRTPPPSGDEIRHAEAALGAPLPDEVLALYQATGSLDCFGHRIPTVDKLAWVREQAADDLDDIRNTPAVANRIWGPAPQDDALALSAGGLTRLFFERSGPNAGHLIAFEPQNDFGYREVAPSLEALLSCWEKLAVAGLVIMVGTEVHGAVDYDFDREEEVVQLLESMPCTPASVEILDLGP